LLFGRTFMLIVNCMLFQAGKFSGLQNRKIFNSNLQLHLLHRRLRVARSMMHFVAVSHCWFTQWEFETKDRRIDPTRSDYCCALTSTHWGNTRNTRVRLTSEDKKSSRSISRLKSHDRDAVSGYLAAREAHNQREDTRTRWSRAADANRHWNDRDSIIRADR